MSVGAENISFLLSHGDGGKLAMAVKLASPMGEVGGGRGRDGSRGRGAAVSHVDAGVLTNTHTHTHTSREVSSLNKTPLDQEGGQEGGERRGGGGDARAGVVINTEVSAREGSAREVSAREGSSLIKTPVDQGGGARDILQTHALSAKLRGPAGAKILRAREVRGSGGGMDAAEFQVSATMLQLNAPRRGISGVGFSMTR